MGDLKNSNPLPPGCRFYPTDQQILIDYLTHKNNNDDQDLGVDVIKEIDLYNYNPFDLPETTCFRFGRGGRKRHWYCYSGGGFKEKGISLRRAGEGFWKRRGRVRDVVSAAAGKVVLGTRKTFVFHFGDSTKNGSRKTDWVMHEYALRDHHLASFVLCRVFVESPRGNNNSEPALSSCGEQSVGTVRHIGVQYDETISEAKVHDNNSDYQRRNEILTFPVCEQRSSGHISGGTMIVDALTTQQLIAILEEDFIELDDLVCPLPGVD